MSSSTSTAFTGDHSGYLTRATLAVAILLAGIIYVTHRFLSDPLRNVPGPILARFTRLWEVQQVRKAHFEQVNVDLHKKLGPVVRIGPGRYSIDEVAATKQIYNHASKFAKSTYYDSFGDGVAAHANLFNDRDSSHHGQSRRKVASLYSMSSMLSYERYVDHCTAILLSKLGLFAEKQQAIDVPTWMQYYAFDVIGEITIGQSFGMMERGYDSMGILALIDAMLEYSSTMGVLAPEWQGWIAWLGQKLGAKSPFQPINDFAQERVDARRIGKNTTDRDDFLAKVLVLEQNGKAQPKDILGVTAGNIVAGSDTTAITLSATIYYLFHNPDCKRRLCGEIEDFAAQGKIEDPITFAQAQQMPYLQAVLKEGLRMHPATGAILARDVPAGGAVLAGHYFPAGTTVGVNAWVLHKNTAIFGPDAASFRPERWLDEDKAKVSFMNENLFAFGAGARTCIGKNISLLEMNKVLVQIYRKFDLEHVDSAKGTEWQTRNVFFVKQKFECKLVQKV